MKIKKIVLLTVAAMSMSFNSFAEDEKANIGTIGFADSLEQRIEIEQQQARLEQVQLERKRTQESLSEDKFMTIIQNRERELRAEFKNREIELMNEIGVLTVKLNELTSLKNNQQAALNNSIEGLSNSVYVTSISGKGSNLVATIYINEAVVKVSEGADLNNNVVVSEVHTNGITLSDGGKEFFIPLTNEAYAFSKTFNRAAMEMMSNQSNGLNIRR
jgi:hypothetical protein